MKNYDELRRICERTSRISERVVDDFLIQYAAGHHGLGKKMEQQFERYRHLKKQLGNQALNMLKSQYLAHLIFKHEGLLGRFIKHPALDRFKGEERDYLAQQIKQPWRFSFSVIVDGPAEDFYLMEDVLSGKQFLLYSPGVSNILDSDRPALWFNLIGFNGSCWQSYGPVVYYNSFEADDIFFFATELNPDIGDFQEVAADVERDPLPYMMLLTGSTYPMTYHKEDQILYLLAEHDLEALDTAGLKRAFKTEYDSGVYRMTHHEWGAHPHFAEVFFDEEQHLLLFNAMTERGFAGQVEALNAFGHDFPAEPYLRVNMTMVTTANEILKRKVVLNEYHGLFKEAPDPVKDKVLEDINAFIALVLPDINAGITPDIEEAIRKTGIDPENARSVMESVMGRLENLPGEMPVPGKKQAVSKKLPAASKQLPVQPSEGTRLLSSDDELLFDLHLYMLTSEIRRLAPWDYLFEDDLFGVQVPGTELVYYVSVMGSDGEFEALTFYKGHEGLTDFLEFRAKVDQLSDPELDEAGLLRASTMVGGVMTIPHILLSFADREELDRENLAAIRKSGARVRGNGNWPRIEEIVPGYVPVYPGRETLIELYLVMQQALVVLEKAMEDDRYLIREADPEGTLLVRVPAGKGPKFRWKDHYLVPDPRWGEVSYSVNVKAGTRTELSRLPETGSVLQIELIMLPTPVKDMGRKGYFPFALLMVEKGNGLIRSYSILAPKPDLRSMYESVPQKVMEELVKFGHRPSKIEIRTDLLFDTLLEFLDEAGCSVEWVDRMPEMDEAIASMISGMS